VSDVPCPFLDGSIKSDCVLKQRVSELLTGVSIEADCPFWYRDSYSKCGLLEAVKSTVRDEPEMFDAEEVTP